jgi:hypothetical protein
MRAMNNLGPRPWRALLAGGLLITLLWGLFFGLSGTWRGGYDWTDDADFFELAGKLEQEKLGLWETIKYSRNTVPGRFHLMYHVMKSIDISLVGTSFAHWLMLHSIRALVAALCFFYFFRRLGAAWPLAVASVAILWMGPQAAIWYRTGHGCGEGQAMFWLGLTLVALVKSVDATRLRMLWQLLFIVTGILTGLAKETFLLITPALVLLQLWLFKRDSAAQSWKQALRQNALAFFALPLFSAGYVGYILLQSYGTGYTGGVGYAGVGAETTSLSHIFDAGLSLAIRKYNWLSAAVLAALFGHAIIGRIKGDSNAGARLWPLLPPLIIMATWVAPQLVLLAKSGIHERFYVPAEVGTVSFCVAVLVYLQQANRLAGVAATLMLIGYAGLTAQGAYASAAQFAAGRQQNVAMLSYAAGQTPAGGTLLVVADAGPDIEPVTLFKAVFDAYYPDRKLVVYAIDKPPYPDYWQRIVDHKSVVKALGGKTLGDLPDTRLIDSVYIFSKLEQTFLRRAEAWFQPKEFDRREFYSPPTRPKPDWHYVVYARRRGTQPTKR